MCVFDEQEQADDDETQKKPLHLSIHFITIIKNSYITLYIRDDATLICFFFAVKEGRIN